MFFVFEIKSTYWRRKTIMVAWMFKMMGSIRIKSGFLANNCNFILWSDLLLFSFKSDFCEKERFYSFEGCVLWHSRKMLDIYKFFIIWKKRNFNVMQINILNRMFICGSKLTLLSIFCENLLLQNKGTVNPKGPYFGLFYENK